MLTGGKMGSWGLVLLVVLVGVEAEVVVEEVVTSPFGIEMWSKQAYKWSKRRRGGKVTSPFGI